MDIRLFKNKTKNAVLDCDITDQAILMSSKFFLKKFKDIFSSEEMDDFLKMTYLTVFFEGFYQFLPDNSLLKSRLLSVRLERWKNHYGTPIVEFLITFHREIKQIKKIFNENIFSEFKFLDINKNDFKINKENFIYIDEKASLRIPLPLKDESRGEFIKTHNKMGGFTTTPSDPISIKFIDYVAENKGRVVLEIGAAFGTATLKVLSKDAIVYCNDINHKNLAVVKNRYLNQFQAYDKSQPNNLVLLPASFPDELSLPQNFFDAILICRVLHFFSGEKINKSLSQLFECLKPGGKLFVVCETPYLKNWNKFLPEYQRRKAEGQNWPGEIHNPEVYEDSGFIGTLPRFVHWISKEVLRKVLKKATFRIECITYIDRKGQFPKELLFDGRESVGAIAVKSF